MAITRYHRSRGRRLPVQGITRVNDKTKLKQMELKLKQMELAIANYNKMIRTLKNRMQRRTVDAGATRRTIARYQQGRDDLDVQLGLERTT
jgi:hypothetical protein